MSQADEHALHDCSVPPGQPAKENISQVNDKEALKIGGEFVVVHHVKSRQLPKLNHSAMLLSRLANLQSVEFCSRCAAMCARQQL